MSRVLLITVLAALLTASAAAARDLTRMPRARDEPRRTGCEAYGSGFIRVEGTETCVRLSGDVRAEVGVGGAGAAFVPGAR